jgi:hypothetical protein
VVVCRIGDLDVGVSEEFGDDAGFLAGVREFCPSCG